MDRKTNSISSLDDAIRVLVGSDVESDDVLFWLQKCSEDLLHEPFPLATDHAAVRGEDPENGDPSCGPAVSQQEVAGIRNLIASDHLYSKSVASPQSEHSDVELTQVFEEDMPYHRAHDETILSLFPELA